MDDLNGTAPVIESGRISLYFSFFSIHFSLFTWIFYSGKIQRNTLYPYSKGLFLLGAGRECERDTPRKEGKLASSHSPLSLGFPSRALPSLILSPLKAEALNYGVRYMRKAPFILVAT